MDFLDSILNNIDEALIITDAQGKILLFNEIAADLSKTLKLTKRLQEGELLFDVANPRRRKVVADIIRDLQSKKRHEKSFAEYNNHQGSTVYLDFDYVPIQNEENVLTHIFVFIRDITHQKVFERKLTTQSANINNLIEKANAIIIGVDTLGYVTDWNEHCVKVTGFSKEDAYASKLADILIPVDGVLESYFVSNYEITVRAKGNASLTLLLSGTPRTTPTGEVIGYTLVGQDITELTGYRQSLERKIDERTLELEKAHKKEQEAVELKSRFVSIASHEFRIPLSTIQYSTTSIRRHMSITHNKEIQSKLDTIETQVKHMTHLLDDVLTYGKSEVGKINLVPVSIVLPEFLKNIIEGVRHSTQYTHTILPDFHNIPETIVTDEKLLRNIVINLLTNAIKFSPGKQYVDLIVRKMSNDLVINVRDEGIGIPPEEVEKIFEPFLRGKGVGEIQGTGLGLSIVKKALDLLNATIQVDSQPGKGTTFTVTIPEMVLPS